MSGTGIWRIEGLQNNVTQDTRNKMTFRKGETVTARILNINKASGEVVLRLIDGRQFPAKIDSTIEDGLLENYLLKFVVDDYKDGQLMLNLKDKLANINKDGIKQNEKEVLMNIIKNLGLNISKGDEGLVKQMLNFNIPLTQDNLDEIKSLMEFQNKIIQNPKEEDVFIDKYLSAKNLSPNSEEGIKVKNTLKEFFSSLKTLDLKSVLMMKEENIPMTKENIQSFNALNKESNVIGNNIQELEQTISTIKNQVEGNNKGVDVKNVQNTVVVNEEVVSQDDVVKNNVEVSKKEEAIKTEVLTKEKLEVIDKELSKKLKLPLHESVKGEIKEKVSEMQQSITNLIKENEDNPETFAKVMKFVEAKMQDFKMFNNLSNDYYYLNVPMNVNKQDYDCKLVIKDERGKGKKLDSTNMKIATSIKTVNMEVVDAYISVNNYYINVEIKAEKEFMDMIELYKDKLLEDLRESPYSFEVAVHEKINEFTLSNCRDFFNDESISTLDLRV